MWRGNDKPHALFALHYVAYVEVNESGKFYDPSYGKVYDLSKNEIDELLSQMTTSAIAGFFSEKRSRGEVWFRTKANDTAGNDRVEIDYKRRGIHR